MQLDLLCPVENQGVTVKSNSKTGEPYVLFRLFNLSRDVVTAVSFLVRAYDAFGGELGTIRVDLQDLSATPKSFFAENKAVSLAEYAEAKHVTVEFLEVHFEEAEPYIAQNGLSEISVTEPDTDERNRLVSVAGDDAFCYAQDAGTHWICVCGRPNLNGVEACVRCERDKSEVMAKYSSRDTINQQIVEQMEAQRQAEEAAKEAAMQAKALRRAKQKKAALIAACAVAIVAVLCVIGYFIYGGIMTLMGNSAAKSGDYQKAYDRYVAARSSKADEIAEMVRGNSFANIAQSGILASDEENIYYITDGMTYSIYKEAKATGEKTQLGSAAGVYLNVSDEWVYYLDVAKKGQAICRVSKDGATVETVYEKEDSSFSNLMLIGNELYFIAREAMENVTPDMQEQMAMQGASPYQFRLYCLKIGQDKAKKISDAEVAVFNYYKGDIYYIDEADGSIWSMTRDGKKAKKLVSGPVYSFDIHDDKLYYSDATVDEATGMAKMSLECAALDGTYIESVIGDKMAPVFAFEGEDLYFITQTEETIAVCKKTAAEETVIAEGSQLFNVADGYVMYMDSYGQLMKSTHDKSEFESAMTEDTLNAMMEQYMQQMPSVSEETETEDGEAEAE